MPPAKKDRPEREADSLLEGLGIRSVPIPVDKVAKHLGAVIRYSPLDEELSGMIYIKDDRPIIGVNALHHPNRQRFTIAHETGHLVMHRHLLTEQVHVDKSFNIELRLNRDSVATLGTDTIEVAANRFAAALLVPEWFIEEKLDAIRFDIDDPKPLEEMARQLRVSKQMLEYRFRNRAQLR